MMTRYRFDTVIFDLDGTLADTAPDLTAALNHALGALGRPGIDPVSVRHMVGHGVRVLVERGLAATGGADPALVEAGMPLMLAHYKANICVHTRPFPGVERALDTLAREGVRLAVCTNKLEHLAAQVIEGLGWTGRFAALVGGDTLPVRKPDPACALEALARAGGQTAAYVGDSITDVETARAAGMPCVCVSFGFSDRPATALGADRLIDHYDELVATLETFPATPPPVRAG